MRGSSISASLSMCVQSRRRVEILLMEAEGALIEEMRNSVVIISGVEGGGRSMDGKRSSLLGVGWRVR